MNADERRLLRLYRALPESRREGLLDYADYLLARIRPEDAEPTPTQPLDIPRPDEEGVVKAIKRLRATYPMVDSNKLLHETSALMAQHVMHKRPAAEVIDALEALFRRQYESHA